MRVIGLEPTCLTASDPKSDTSANFATPAFKASSLELIQERENKGFLDDGWQLANGITDDVWCSHFPIPKFSN